MRKCLKVEYLGWIEYDFQKYGVTGPWDIRFRFLQKKCFKKIHACVHLSALPLFPENSRTYTVCIWIQRFRQFLTQTTRYRIDVVVPSNCRNTFGFSMWFPLIVLDGNIKWHVIQHNSTISCGWIHALDHEEKTSQKCIELHRIFKTMEICQDHGLKHFVVFQSAWLYNRLKSKILALCLGGVFPPPPPPAVETLGI